MQGLKHFSPQLFYQTSLELLVPQDNFYRILKKELNLRFLYKATSAFYGKEGQAIPQGMLFAIKNDILRPIFSQSTPSHFLDFFLSQQKYGRLKRL